MFTVMGWVQHVFNPKTGFELVYGCVLSFVLTFAVAGIAITFGRMWVTNRPRRSAVVLSLLIATTFWMPVFFVLMNYWRGLAALIDFSLWQLVVLAALLFAPFSILVALPVLIFYLFKPGLSPARLAAVCLLVIVADAIWFYFVNQIDMGS